MKFKHIISFVLACLLLTSGNQVKAAVNPDAYQVFQNSIFMKHFSNYNDALSYAQTLQNAWIVDMSNLKSVWNNFLNPDAYQVFQNGTFLERFSTLNDAISFSNSITNAMIIDMSTLKPVTGYNPDAYQVFQYSNFLKHFSNYNDALTYAQQWDHSRIIDMSNLNWVWNNYPKPTSAPPTTTTTYSVVSGDTLSKIASKFGVSLDSIMKANPNINSSYMIYVGQIIVIPAQNSTPVPVTPMPAPVPPAPTTTVTTYKVVSGDTLSRIAVNYGTTVNAIMLANPSLKNSSFIYVGETLTIPTNSSNPNPPTTPTSPSNSKTIIIDPGHGGNDPGAIGLDGTHEEMVNLQIAEKVKAELLQRGYKVIMVRDTNTSCDPATTDVATELQCRVDLSKKNNADIYVSIHANESSSSGSHGTTTYYNADNQYDGSENPYPTKSKSLATSVENNVTQEVGTYSFGAVENDYYVLRKNTVPAILIETAFLSNSSDLSKLKSDSTQNLFALGIANGIDQYFKTN